MSLVKIEASFDPSNPAHLTAAMNFLSTVGGNVTPSGNQAPAYEPKEETPTPKKNAPRKKKTDEVAETTKTTTADAPKEDVTGPETPIEVEEKTVTLEDIRTLTSKKAKDHREAIKAKLTEWGVPNVVKIPEDKYQEFIDFLNTL